MARSELNTVTYFPLYCDEGKKMFYIEETYGNDGFAAFIKILRELAKTDYHYLDLSKSTSLMFLSAKCKVGKELLSSIISDLVELGKFDKELWDSAKVIWCQDFIDSIQDAYKKRNNNCIDRKSLLELLYSKGILIRPKSNPKQPKIPSQGVDNTQIKEKDIKEEENKETLFESLWENYPNKDNKKKAKEKFFKLENEDIELIKIHLPIFSVTKKFATYNHPQLIVYLNQERFRDEVTDGNKEKSKVLWVEVLLNHTYKDMIKSEYLKAVKEGYINCDNPKIIKEYYK